MKKEFRKKTVSMATKIPAYTVSRKKRFDLKKDLPAYILLVLFIFWTIGSIFGIIAYQRNKGISASADDFYVNSVYVNEFNPYIQPYNGYASILSTTPFETVVTSNRLDLGYTSVNIPIDIDLPTSGVIYLSGEMSKTGDNVPALRLQYINSLSVSTYVCCTLLQGSTGVYWSESNWTSFVPPADSTLCLSMYYHYGSANHLNSVGNPIYRNIMVNSRTTGFIPNIDAMYTYGKTDGYNIGYAQGEEDGYEQGRIDGLKKGDISFLVGAKAKAIYALSSNFEEETVYYESNASGGTVAFDSLYNALPVGAYSYLNVTIDFASPVYGRNLYLNAYGNRGIFYDGDTPKVFTALTESGERLNARFVYNESEDNYGLELQISSFDFYLVRLEAIPVATRSNLETFSLRVPNSSYREGYNDGYNVGVKDNATLQEQYELGLSQGFSQGKVIGYNEGIEDANTYTFTNLLGSVFDVPIKAFNGLLNFEVLGVNLRGFYLSLLTACLVLVIIRLFI